jgi:hypothetical protein
LLGSWIPTALAVALGRAKSLPTPHAEAANERLLRRQAF